MAQWWRRRPRRARAESHGALAQRQRRSEQAAPHARGHARGALETAEAQHCGEAAAEAAVRAADSGATAVHSRSMQRGRKSSLPTVRTRRRRGTPRGMSGERLAPNCSRGTAHARYACAASSSRRDLGGRCGWKGAGAHAPHVWQALRVVHERHGAGQWRARSHRPQRWTRAVPSAPKANSCAPPLGDKAAAVTTAGSEVAARRESQWAAETPPPQRRAPEARWPRGSCCWPLPRDWRN